MKEKTISIKLNKTQENRHNVQLKNATKYGVEKNRSLSRFLVFVCLIFTFLILGFANSDSALAKTKKHAKAVKAVQTKPYSAIVVDAATGEVLMARQADSIRHPASLTKMMTLYMLFSAIESGQLRMNDRIEISAHAASMAPSKMGIPVGQSIAVDDAVQAIVTKSANDVAAAISEKLGGSERGFCAQMTRKAHDLGMSRTNFRNASGLPDPQQVTSARDMAKLAMALLRDFPQYYHYFGIRNFEYKGMVIPNHNRLLGEYPGLDGIKTGYINDSGFNLVASAKQNGRRLVGVVFGGQTWRSRNNNMVQLLNAGFEELGRRRSSGTQVASASTVLPIPLPNAIDEAAAVDATTDSDADEPDVAEDSTGYTSADGQKLAAIINQAQGDDAKNAATIAATASTRVGVTSKASVPVPPQRPAFSVMQLPQTAPAAGTPANTPVQVRAPIPTSSVPPTPVAVQTPPAPVPAPAPVAATASAASSAKTSPATAARTVMQLRVPAAQAKAIPAAQIASAAQPQGWSIQVGAFPSRAMTDQALRTAQSRLPNQLQSNQPVIVPQNTQAGMIFRARLQGYNEIQANAACAHLGSCLVVAPGS